MHVRTWLLGLLAILICSANGRDGSAAEKGPQLSVPPGFEVELVAGPPLVEHPTMACFDDQGRLYVCDGPGLNLPAKELLKDLPNRIVRLEDTDGDGRFDRRVDYADKMTFPMGAQWHDGSIYTASPPNIWKLSDTDGDGKADRRDVLVSEFGFTGNAADIHGCFLGPDGRLYWCDGRHGHNFVDEHGNQISKGLAARVFSCRLDGKDVESFAGGGMDNPVELTFTAEGEPLGTVAIFDIVDGRHDALVHWVYGGVYPRYEQPCIKEFRRTGDLLPALSRFGQIAPSGVERYRAGAFGKEFADSVFIAQFNTHRVSRTTIQREGATFRSQDEDFLTSDDPDFHPTDVTLDADGSLLVVNTGGWFRIGCPTSRIAKPEILGGIYRVRRTGAPKVADTRGQKLAWDAPPRALLERLRDDRFAVRERAVAELARRGEAAVEPIKKFHYESPDARARGLAVWALCRIGSPAARAAIRAALPDRDPGVRQIAVRAVGTLRDAEAFDEICELVESDAPQIRRDAATALGRMGVRAGVPVLLSALRTGGDPFLEHAMIYALIQLDDRQATLAGLKAASTQVRRGALIALDQMKHGNLERDEVLPLLDTGDTALQKAVLDIIERHEGWAAGTVSLIEKWLTEPEPNKERAALLRGALLGFSREPKLQSLVAQTLANSKTPLDTRLMLLDVIGRSEVMPLPAPWAEQLAANLESSDPSVVREAVSAVGARGAREFDGRLLRVAHNSKLPEELRSAALVLAARHGSALGSADFDRLVHKLPETVAPVDRLAAAEGLGAAALEPEQLKELLGSIAAAGPLELPALLRAFEKDHDPETGRKLIAALDKSPGIENLPVDQLRKLLANYPSAVREAGEPLVRKLNADIDQQRARLTELAQHIDGGNAAHGRTVFFGKKASCSACHRVGKEGASIGPDLTKVGQIRSRNDLLESLIYPSMSFARGYESFTVLTDAGQVYSGIMGRQTPDSIYLRTAQREELRIPRSEIEAIAPSKASIMPQGFDKLLTSEELRDVFAFLLTLK